MDAIVKRLMENHKLEKMNEGFSRGTSKLMDAGRSLFPSAPESSYMLNYCDYDSFSHVLHYTFDIGEYSLEQFISDMETIGATRSSDKSYGIPDQYHFFYAIPLMKKDRLCVNVKEL